MPFNLVLTNQTFLISYEPKISHSPSIHLLQPIYTHTSAKFHCRIHFTQHQDSRSHVTVPDPTSVYTQNTLTRV